MGLDSGQLPFGSRVRQRPDTAVLSCSRTLGKEGSKRCPETGDAVSGGGLVQIHTVDGFWGATVDAETTSTVEVGRKVATAWRRAPIAQRIIVDAARRGMGRMEWEPWGRRR